jgi:hypothetical protein
MSPKDLEYGPIQKENALKVLWGNCVYLQMAYWPHRLLFISRQSSTPWQPDSSQTPRTASLMDLGMLKALTIMLRTTGISNDDLLNPFESRLRSRSAPRSVMGQPLRARENSQGRNCSMILYDPLKQAVEENLMESTPR